MARQINFGLWYDLRNPAPSAVSFETLYAQCIEQMQWAEGIGFDSVWLTEHHFCEDGYTPSPLVVAAAIGASTKRMRVATNLMLLPLADPVRIAEDTASLAILTDGRFDLGVGIGYRELEFNYFGRKLSHRPSLMEESVAILRKAWRGEPINFSGKRFEIGDVSVNPVAKTPPRLLMGGMAEPAIQRAARIGDGFLSTGGIGHDVYAAACKAEGKNGAIFAGNWAIISPDPEAEAAKVGPYALYQSNEYIKWGAFGPPDQTPEFPDGATALEQGLYEVWDADQAVQELTTMLKAYPQIQDIHFWAQLPGESVESGSARIQYMSDKVLPQVRAAIA